MMFKNHFTEGDDGSIFTSEELLTKLSEEKEEVKFYLRKITKADETEAESLASIAVKDAIKEQPIRKDKDSVSVCLYKIATNVAIDHIRKNKKNS